MEKIIFFGDSITNHFELLKRNENIINYGVGGDTTIKLIGRVKDVIVEQPDKLFLLIGINDYLLNQDFYDEKLFIDFEKTYETLLKHISDNLKNTIQYFISIFPVVNLGDLEEVKRMNQEIDSINDFIKLMANKYNAKYVDIAKYLKSEYNSLIELYTGDGLHLNDAGYEKYYKEISKYF